MIRSPASLKFAPRYDIAAGTSAGADPHVQLENQDNFLLVDVDGRAAFMHGQELRNQQLPSWPHGHIRLAVLDGMGGHGQGRQAAEAVVAGLLAIPACATIEELSAHLDMLHASLQQHFAAGGDAARRPGTTLTLLEIPPGQAPLLYHVGDSRLYELTPTRVSPMTVDHVPATAFAMAGVLGEQEWWQQVHGEHRSQIAQAFILGNAFEDNTALSDRLYALTPDNLPACLRHLPDRRAIALRQDAVYLLATDGFWACTEPHLWVRGWPAMLVRPLSARDTAGMLFDQISGHPPPGLHIDNLTAIVLRPLPDSGHEDETYA
jgi:serine/threonine protein phosphatase PrpC